MNFILGRSGTGKTFRCLKEIAESQKKNDSGSIILIVPEQFTLQAERDLLKITEGDAMLKARVLSFKRLAYNVFSKDGNEKTTHLSRTAKVMLLRKIMEERKDELVFFKSLGDKTGFMRQLGEMIRELFSYGIEPSDLVKEDNPDKYLKGKLADLSLIYSDYRDFVRGGYLTEDDTLDMLLPKLEKSELLKNSEIWIDGFFGFTPQEYAVIGKLIKIAKNVTVALTMDEEAYIAKSLDVSSLFYETWLTSRKLRDICKGLGVKVSAVISKTGYRYKSCGLKTVEESFIDTNIIGEKSDGVSVFSATDIYDEAEQTAAQIVSLVRNEGLRYRDIAVFVPNESYHTVIKGCFNDFDIPTFMDNKKKAALHPLSETVRSVIDIIAYDFSYENVFAYLKAGLSPLESEEVDILENYCLSYGIKGYKWRSESWRYGKNTYSDEELLFINTLKDKVIKPLEPLYERLRGGRKATVSEICFLTVEFLKSINAAEKIAAQTDEFKLCGKTERAYENEQCWEAVMQVLKDAAAILGEKEMTVKDFATIFEAGITDVDVGIIPFGIDCVTVGDIKRSRLPDIKALFVLGVNEGVIPSGNATDRLINDDERELMSSFGVELASWGRRKSFEEEFLIYCAMTKAEERLYLSCCTGDLEGNSLKESRIITKLLKTFPDVKVQTVKDFSPSFRVVNEKTALKAAAERGSLSESIKEAFCENEDMLKAVKRVTNLGVKTDKLSREITDRLYGRGLYTSISRLEKYAACPFSYFLSYNIKAEERKLYTVEAPDMGSILHEIIEAFSSYVTENKILWTDISKEECERLAEEIVDEIIPTKRDELFSSSGSMRYMVTRLKRIAKRSVWVIVKHIKAGHFYPAGYEVGFGAGENLPPVTIKLADGGSLVLNGKIDRVDYFDKDGVRYVKIIDYKSGRKAFSLKEVYYGLQLQLALYMDSVIKNLEKEGHKALPGGMFYYRVADPAISVDKSLSEEDIERLLFGKLKMSGLVLKDEEVYKALDKYDFEDSSIIPLKITKSGEAAASSSVADEKSYKAILSFAEKRAAQIGESIVKGDISVSPFADGEKTPCTYCAYKSVCLIDERQNREKTRSLENVSKSAVMGEETKKPAPVEDKKALPNNETITLQLEEFEKKEKEEGQNP